MAKLSLPSPHEPYIDPNTSKISEVWYRYLDKNKTEVNSKWFVDVQNDFDAAGDGVKDDTVKIQAALDSGESVIYIPPGTYNISDDLVVPTTVDWIFGVGSDISHLEWVGANGSGSILDLSGPYGGLTVEGLQISKPWTGTPSGGVAIYLNADNVKLRNLYIPHGGRFGIYCEEGSSNNLIEDCYIADCRSNLLAAYNNTQNITLTVRRTTFDHNFTAIHQAVQLGGGPAEGNKILLEDCTKTMVGTPAIGPGGFFISQITPGYGVVGCRFFQSTSDAVELGGNSRGFVIKNNIYSSTVGDDVGFGVSPETGDTCIYGVVSGNFVKGNGGQGLAIGFHGATQYMTVSDNTIYDPCQSFAATGIAVINCDDCDIINNSIRKTAGAFAMNYGVQEIVTTSGDRNRFGNNDIHGAGTADLLVVAANTKVWEPVWT